MEPIKRSLFLARHQCSSACFSRNCIFWNWKMISLSVRLKVSLETSSSEARSGKKNGEYFLHFDRNNFPKNWTTVDFLELKNKGTPFS